MKSGYMKTEYKLGEDIFIVMGVFLIAASIIMRVLNVSWNLGLTAISAKAIFQVGVVSLLLSVALNLQELARKPR